MSSDFVRFARAQGLSEGKVVGLHVLGLGADELLQGFADRWREELAAGAVRFDDTGFSGWVHRECGPSPICWDVHPVHLHYRISEVVR